MSASFSIIAIGSSLFGAIASILARTLLKSLTSKEVLGVSFLTTVATLVIISPLFYQFQSSPLAISLIVAIAFIDTLGNYFFFKTFENTEASLATPMLSLSPVFSFVFAWLVIGDTVKFSTFGIALLILIGILVFSIDFKNFAKFRSKTLQPALLSSLLFGISSVPSKYLLTTLHAVNAPTLYMFRGAFISLFALLFFRFPLRDITNRQYFIIFVRGLFVISQWILLYLALAKGSAGVTLTLANITPIFVFFFGTFFLKEKPTARKVATALLILLLSAVLK